MILNEIKKPKELSPRFLNKIEQEYGPVDMENDFFSDNLKTYYKTTNINSKTDSVEHKLINLPNFSSSLKKLSLALNALKKTSKTKVGKKDEEILNIFNKLNDLFNQYRTHLRNNYPEQYETIKNQLKEMSTTGGGAGASSFSGGTGMQYTTPYAFKKKNRLKESKGSNLGPGPKAGPNGVNKNYYVTKFKYKLVPNKIKNSGLEKKQLFESLNEFQEERIKAFDIIEGKLNDIYKMLSNAKNKTVNYYKTKPTSYDVVVPTDLILDYIKDIEELLNT